jgi:hypothetical protein
MQHYNTHILTLKHKNNTLAINGNKKLLLNCSIHNCSHCNYITNIKTNYDKHLLTDKHKKNVNGEPKDARHICSQCNKEYLNYNALWKHKKQCCIVDNKTQEEDPEKDSDKLQNTFVPTNIITPELVIDIIKQSKELQQVLIEQNKELQNKLLEKENEFQHKLLEKENTMIEQNKQIIELAKNQSVVHNNTTNNNQQFNLQLFLNETCKDAMNIVDFVNSLQLTTDDFETTGKLGFVDGISRIFIKELKKLDTEKLPIHCTDFKRETVYIKDNDIWEKENDEKKRVKWAIDTIAQLNLNQLQQWQEKFPECRENNTPANEHFFKLARVALGGFGKEEEDKFREKIMRNVLKEVVLDKKAGKPRIPMLPLP